MPRFFTASPPENNIFSLSGDDYFHISRSLRMRTGEEISVCYGGKNYLCRLSDITSDCAYARIVSELCSGEPSIDVTLFQALPKSDKLEQIIQKSVELGVKNIVPVMTKRCVARPERSQFESRLKRYQKISEAAAKQSGRGIIPEVSGIISFEECISRLKDFDLSLILYEKEGGKRLSRTDFSGASSIALIVGSEGGFERDEAEAANNAGAERIWLGERILRCETAPLAALAVIMSITGNL